MDFTPGVITTKAATLQLENKHLGRVLEVKAPVCAITLPDASGLANEEEKITIKVGEAGAALTIVQEDALDDIVFRGVGSVVSVTSVPTTVRVGHWIEFKLTAAREWTVSGGAGGSQHTTGGAWLVNY